MIDIRKRFKNKVLFLFLATVSFLFILANIFFVFTDKKVEKDNELFELFLNLSKKDFELILLKNFNVNFKSTESDLAVELKNEDFENIFKILHLHKAILLDLDLIKGIEFINLKQQTDLSFILPTKIKNFEYFSKFVYQKRKNSIKQNKKIIEFGLFLDSFSNLAAKLEKKCEIKCKIDYLVGKYLNKEIISGLNLNCSGLLILISLVHRRGNFLWIPAHSNAKNLIETRYFGDVPRALRKYIAKSKYNVINKDEISHFNFKRFNTSIIIDEESNRFYVPSNLKFFLFEYNNSKFLECNQDLRDETFRMHGVNYVKLDENKINKILADIEYVAYSLESMYKNYFISSGTLLGWYRECRIFPHAEDADFDILIDDYSNDIKNHFRGNPNIYLHMLMGVVNKIFELRLKGKFYLDLFVINRANETHLYSLYQIGRKRYSIFLPSYDALCSAELHENRYFIPCEPTKYLEMLYGKNWTIPITSGHRYSSWKFIEKWSDEDWPNAIRFYDENGSLRLNITLEHINQFNKYNLTQLPSEN